MHRKLSNTQLNMLLLNSNTRKYGFTKTKYVKLQNSEISLKSTKTMYSLKIVKCALKIKN